MASRETIENTALDLNVRFASRGLRLGGTIRIWVWDVDSSDGWPDWFGGLKGFGRPDYTVKSKRELEIFLDAARLCQSRHSKDYDRRRKEGKLRVTGLPNLADR
jgi:hypothetical protein